MFWAWSRPWPRPKPAIKLRQSLDPGLIAVESSIHGYMYEEPLISDNTVSPAYLNGALYIY